MCPLGSSPSRKYPRPFEGKPSTIPLNSLCLFPPQAFLALNGFPTIRGCFTALGKEGLFKSIERAAKSDHWKPEAVDKLLSMAEDQDREFPEVLKSALLGNNKARDQLELYGEWNAFLMGWESTPIEQRPYFQRFIYALDQHSAQVLRAWRNGNYEEALAQIRGSAFMRQMLSDDDMAGFVPGRPLESLLGLRIAASMESHLGVVVAMLRDAESQSPGQLEQVRALLPHPAEPEVTPLMLLMRWLLRQAGVDSATALAEQLAWSDKVPAEMDALANLERWRDGSHFPRWKSFKAVCDAVGVDKKDYPGGHYLFARHLNFLGWVDESIRTVDLPRLAPGSTALFPWPRLPHGFLTFPEWLSARFESWCEYHQNNQDVHPRS
jgi:hypothetical protein